MSAKFAADVSEATNELTSLKEPTLQCNAQLVENQRKHNFSTSTGNINNLMFYMVMFCRRWCIANVVFDVSLGVGVLQNHLQESKRERVSLTEE